MTAADWNRFWSKVTVARGCWLWSAARSEKGYGHFRDAGGRTRLSHRVAFREAYGTDPGKGFVCHKCDVPACVRPSHLFLGTNDDNVADMVAKGRTAKGARHGASRSTGLTDTSVMSIRTRVADGERQLDIAREMGLPLGTISNVVHGYAWTHLPVLRNGKSRWFHSLSDDDVARIVADVRSGLSQRECGRRYGVTRGVIGKIVRGHPE